MRVDIYITVDSLAPKSTKKRYAYLLECALKSGEMHKSEYCGAITGTYHRVVLAAMADALEKLKYGCDVHLHVNDAHVLGTLKNFLPMWAKKKFHTSKGKAVANMKEWQQLWEQVQKHNITTHPGIHEKEEVLKREIKREFF